MAISIRPAAPLWLLVLITASGTLGMHIFVPALPQTARDFGVGTSATQLTISVYLLGLAAGQLFYGPLSDRFGRRPVLFAGLALYAVSGLAAALAPGLASLVGARLCQALGGCAGLVLGRAIVRDTSEPQQTAARLALLNVILTISPGVAPIIGGWLTELFGWRSIFAALCALGSGTLLAAVIRLPETGTRASGGGAATLLRGYGHLLRSPAFVGYVIAGACTTTSMYAFMAASPFIFVEQLHRPVSEVGIYYFILIMGATLGSFLANRLVAPLGMERLLQAAAAIGTLGAALYLAAVLSGHLSVASAVIPVFLFTVGAGTASPMALTKAVSTSSRSIGTAAGLYGFGQMAVGALCTVLGGIGNDPALASSIVLITASLIGQLGIMVALRSERARET